MTDDSSMDPLHAAARLRRDRADPPAPLPVPAGRSHHRVRARPAHRRHQERVAQRAVRWRTRPTGPVLPPTILTEAVAQVGAILILSKPENREKLPFFMGIEKVRYRQPVRPGDVVEIEAVVKRLRSRMGMLKGVGTRQRQGRRRRHDDVRARPARRQPAGRIALVDHAHAALRRTSARIQQTPCVFGLYLMLPRGAHDDQDRAHLQRARRPGGPARLGLDVAPRVERRRREDHHAHPRLVDIRARRPSRACRARTGRSVPKAAVAYADRRQDVEGEHALGERRVLVAAARAAA